MNRVLLVLPFAVSVAVFGGLVVSVGSAQAQPDPVGAVSCVAETPAGVTELVDPAALLDPAGLVDPAGLPGVSCLAP